MLQVALATAACHPSHRTVKLSYCHISRRPSASPMRAGSHGRTRHLSPPGFHRRADQGGPPPQIQGWVFIHLLEMSKMRAVAYVNALKVISVHARISSLSDSTLCVHIVLSLSIQFTLQGTCQSCGAGGPNLWACLQVGSLKCCLHLGKCCFSLCINDAYCISVKNNYNK